MTSPRSALIAGATGLVGSHVLRLLLNGPRYTSVSALVRRPLGIEHAKLREHGVDFDALEETWQAHEIDDVFLCLGTTIAVAGSQEAFRRVDHDYTVAIARMARERGAVRLALVSSVGASERATSFYLRVKGETERAVSELGYASVEVFRPSFLVGERAERRRGEAVAIAATGAMSWAMVGGLRAYRPIEASRVASAMVRTVEAAEPGIHIHTYSEIMAESGIGP